MDKRNCMEMENLSCPFQKGSSKKAKMSKRSSSENHAINNMQMNNSTYPYPGFDVNDLCFDDDDFDSDIFAVSSFD